jgi:translation initiation factor 4G
MVFGTVPASGICKRHFFSPFSFINRIEQTSNMGIDKELYPDEKLPRRESYLAQALQSMPESAQPADVEDEATYNSSASYQHHCDPIIPLHSDLTIPYSNVRDISTEIPVELNTDRRSVFGGREKQKYCIHPNQATSNYGVGSSSAYHHHYDEPQQSSSLNLSNSSSTASEIMPESMFTNHGFDGELSDVSQPGSPEAYQILPRDLLSPPPASATKKRTKMHETLHAQSLILGLAFMAIWSPQNCMAPNLTQMADDFGFSDTERDVYLGANVALATGVLSLPISAGIGILADVYNRKYLFCLTVALGGFSSWLTGASQSYRMLFFARLLNGSFMSGSVPVAFSLLGDLFDTHERNAASSGLTAMMGLGIIAGQVYAGVVGSCKGWPHAFYVSAVLTIMSAVLVLLLVREPIRGGKEAVLQAMLKHGTSYERKLTWSGFCQTMRNSQSNMLLIWQGFFSSIPWGIIFVFLNDYLSQERGFSVPDATYLVAVFGAGCAVGGILGGYWGQQISDWNRSYLPVFMAATTFLGIFPFVGLLNGHFTNAHGVLAVGYSFVGGFVASLPSVCVRPCLLNVNPPESRGAALTAANLIIQLARGAGPSCITLMSAILRVDRQFSFNFTVSGCTNLSTRLHVYDCKI